MRKMNKRLLLPSKTELRNIRARRQTLWRICSMTVFLLFFCMGLSPGIIWAEEMPDLSMNGQSSISITMRDKNTDEAIPGGTLELIQIASVVVDNGFVFVPTEQFAAEDFTFDLSEKADLSDPALAAGINTYVENHSASVTQRTQKPIGTEGEETGKAAFEGLDLGVYLIREIEAPEGYAKINPFLVTIPQKTDAGHVYQVDASPKAGKVSELTEATVVCPVISKTVTAPENTEIPGNAEFRFVFERLDGAAPSVINGSGAVSEGGHVVSQDADQIILTLTGPGKLEIGSIIFDKVGEYFYQLTEQRGQDYHYTYDATVYWIKYVVDVNDAGDGLEIKETVVRLGGPTGEILTETSELPFVNPYTPDLTPTPTNTPTPEPTPTEEPTPTPTEEPTPTPTEEMTPTPEPTPTEEPTPTPTEEPTPTPTEEPEPTSTPEPLPSLPDGYYYDLTPTPTPEEYEEEYEEPTDTPTPTPVTNVYTPPGGGSYTPPGGGGYYLPQTGQLWWPMWLLCGAGGILLISGLIVSKRSSDKRK